jgi:hypothetical protein
MKYATKYSVVPYRPQTGEGHPIQEPDEYLISKLDNEMTSILSQKISMDTKMKLYSQTLARFANIYHNNSFNLPSVLAEMSNKTKDVEKNLSEKIDKLGTKLEPKSEPEEFKPISLKEEYPGNFKLEAEDKPKKSIKQGRILKSKQIKTKKLEKKEIKMNAKQVTEILAAEQAKNELQPDKTLLESVNIQKETPERSTYTSYLPTVFFYNKKK